MTIKYGRALSLAAIGAIGGAVLVSGPAQAGDTARVHGCAAHWRNTAAWNECENASNVQVRLTVECDYQFDWTGDWKTVSGTVKAVDRHECVKKATGASNGYR